MKSLNTDPLTQAKFYDVAIKLITRMLDNPRLRSMRHPEDLNAVHATLREIDGMIDDNLFVNQDIVNVYRQIRGPWEKLLTTDSKSKEEFVLGARDFKNSLIVYIKFRRNTNIMLFQYLTDCFEGSHMYIKLGMRGF